jgi:hypothetical protein
LEKYGYRSIAGRSEMIESSDSPPDSQIIDISFLIYSNFMHLSNSIGQLNEVEFLIKDVEIASVEQINSIF